MEQYSIVIHGPLEFKLRFNTTHGDTNLYWRVFINNVEYLAATLQCMVPTHSDASFDTRANTTKYQIGRAHV